MHSCGVCTDVMSGHVYIHTCCMLSRVTLAVYVLMLCTYISLSVPSDVFFLLLHNQYVQRMYCVLRCKACATDERKAAWHHCEHRQYCRTRRHRATRLVPSHEVWVARLVPPFLSKAKIR
eukprot:GHVQ01042961.1.p2 GENE.GHVQ01042961.1~~GHVQ01042961.1.p2  ORF type:complete len:120 (+),score=8.59 GHVQ01042961.1:421-780(+)